MALRIAFDLDGVLADMESELVRQSKILFGEPMTRRLQERAAGAAVAPAAPGDVPAPAPADTDAVPAVPLPVKISGKGWRSSNRA